jgi:F-type H+-transporting ATPase subunit b
MANPGFNSTTVSAAKSAPTLEQAAHEEGAPKTGGEALTVEHGGTGEANHPDPALFGIDATVWVSIAMLVFLAVVFAKGGWRLITGGLDRQIEGIRRRLEEAKQLRAEAEALRDEYARKIADVENQTRAMVSHAEDEAKALIAKAEADAAELVQRRARMAEDKIGAAERAALAEVRAKAADAATRAAAQLLATRHDPATDQALIDRTIAGLGRPN